MAFHIETNSDITKFEGDVIIDSVGVTSTIYGGICGSIIKASGSDELKKIVDGVNDLYSVGEYFMTPGYALPAKNILHLITPSFENDPDYSQFKECIRRVLNECRYRHWKKVGIPSIGTGANKYDKDVSRKIIEEMCSAYCDNVDNKMDIVLVLPEKVISRRNDERIIRGSYSGDEYHDPETKKKFKKGSKAFGDTINKKNTSLYNKQYFAYDRFSAGEDDITFDLKNVKTIGDYVDRYIEKKVGQDLLAPSETKIKHKVNLYLAAGTKGKKDYASAGSDAFGEIKYKSTADKKQLYKIVLALRMTAEEAKTFLKHFGYCFAYKGVNEMDDAISDLISNRQYGIAEASLKMPYFFKK